MDIGTAKPPREVLAEFPHRLIDIRDPAEAYSAAEFRADALAAMAEITAAGKIPLLVGGTMLYYKALLEGLADMPGADPEVRAANEAGALSEGWEALHRQLAEVDPESAARIHPNDPQRLVRALEVFRLGGVSMTAHRLRQASEKAGLGAQGGGSIAVYCGSAGDCASAAPGVARADCAAFSPDAGTGLHRRGRTPSRQK